MGSKLIAAPKDFTKKSVKSTIQAVSVNPLKKPIDHQQQEDVDEGTLSAKAFKVSTYGVTPPGLVFLPLGVMSTSMNILR